MRCSLSESVTTSSPPLLRPPSMSILFALGRYYCAWAPPPLFAHLCHGHIICLQHHKSVQSRGLRAGSVQTSKKVPTEQCRDKNSLREFLSHIALEAKLTATIEKGREESSTPCTAAQPLLLPCYPSASSLPLFATSDHCSTSW